MTLVTLRDLERLEETLTAFLTRLTRTADTIVQGINSLAHSFQDVRIKTQDCIAEVFRPLMDQLNMLAARLEPISIELGNTQTMLEHHYNEIKESLLHINRSEQLRTNYAEQAAPTDADSQAPTRVFYANAELAVRAIQTLLSNTPSQRHAVATGQLPLNELYGLQHALHANTIEWFKHVEHLITSSGRSASNARRELRQELLASLSDLISELRRLSADQAVANQTLNRLQANIEEITGNVSQLELPTLIMRLTEAIRNPGSVSTSEPADYATLPVYQATHSQLRCRTYGTLVWEDNTHKVMMDVTSSPPFH
uniref:Putative serine-rich protein n=1 Tax=Escobaria virus TaxID=1417306 RepID=V5V1U8_9VIRU|nr:putative serine-rich protein [Escobaria virus]